MMVEQAIQAVVNSSAIRYFSNFHFGFRRIQTRRSCHSYERSWLKIFLCAYMLSMVVSEVQAGVAPHDYHWDGYDKKEQFDGMQGGWWFNLGPTGVRAKIEMAEPKVFVVKFVFPDSPGAGKILVGDKVVGVNGKLFMVADHFDYRGDPGKHPLGAKHYFGFDDGPRFDLGLAIEESEGSPSLKGKLTFMVVRAGKSMDVSLQLRPVGYFEKNFPYDCKKSQLLVKEACEWIAKAKKPGAGDGWGMMNVSSPCLLALLSQGDTYMPLMKSYFQARANDDAKPGWSWLNTLGTIPTAEYYLATKDPLMLPLLKRQEQTLVDLAGPNGAFMHHKWAPGGYSEMAFPAGLAGTSWALLKQCGIPIHDEAYERTRLLLTASTRPNGGIGYGTIWTDYKPLMTDINSYLVDLNAAKPNDQDLFNNGSRLAGGAVLATMMHFLDPMDKISEAYVKRGVSHAYNSRRACISGHLTGNMTTQWVMITAGLATVIDEMKTYRAFMDHWKSWLNVARCHNGGWYFEPTSDHQLAAWHSPRLITTGGVVMLLSVPHHKLAILGRDRVIPGLDVATLPPKMLSAYRMVKAGDIRGAITALSTLKKSANDQELANVELIEAAAQAMIRAELNKLQELHESKDVFRLQEHLKEADKKYKGIVAFDQAIAPMLDELKTDEKIKLIEIGKIYYQGIGSLTKGAASSGKGKAWQKANEFMTKYSDTLYATLAQEMTENFTKELDALITELSSLQQEGDIYQVAMKIKVADKEYLPLSAYVEKINDIKVFQGTPESRASMKLGEAYQELAAFAAKSPGTESAKRLAAFATKNPATFYGKKAKTLSESGAGGKND